MTHQRLTPARLRLALEHVGCTCDPEIQQRQGRVAILHDDWCPATHAPTTTIRRLPDGTERATTSPRARALELADLLRRETDATVLLVTDEDET